MRTRADHIPAVGRAEWRPILSLHHAELRRLRMYAASHGLSPADLVSYIVAGWLDRQAVPEALPLECPRRFW